MGHSVGKTLHLCAPGLELSDKPFPLCLNTLTLDDFVAEDGIGMLRCRQQPGVRDSNSDLLGIGREYYCLVRGEDSWLPGRDRPHPHDWVPTSTGTSTLACVT